VNPTPNAYTCHYLFRRDALDEGSVRFFPHTDSTWPNSLKVIKQEFEGVPEDVTRKIVCDNAAKLYNIELN
jgi:hypothetical protein